MSGTLLLSLISLAVTGLAVAALAWSAIGPQPLADQASAWLGGAELETTEMPSAPSDGIGVAPFHVDCRGDLHPLDEGLSGTLRRDEGLAFTYRNDAQPNAGSRTPGFLLIFAVDANKRVVWYTPGHEDKNEHPRSIRCERGEGDGSLPRRVAHTPQPGLLALYVLFSNELYDTKTVERLVAEVEVGDPIPLTKTIQQCKKISVA